jgi:hypothetical protein
LRNFKNICMIFTPSLDYNNYFLTQDTHPKGQNAMINASPGKHLHTLSKLYMVLGELCHQKKEKK